jgi:hypothetical protein
VPRHGLSHVWGRRGLLPGLIIGPMACQNLSGPLAAAPDLPSLPPAVKHLRSYHNATCIIPGLFSTASSWFRRGVLHDVLLIT